MAERCISSYSIWICAIYDIIMLRWKHGKHFNRGEERGMMNDGREIYNINKM
jgi:hypothetical protein